MSAQKLKKLSANSPPPASSHYLLLPNSLCTWLTYIVPWLQHLYSHPLYSFHHLAYVLRCNAELSQSKIPKGIPSIGAAYKDKPSSDCNFFFAKLFPFIVKLALEIADHFPSGKLPILSENSNSMTALQRMQAASLNACSFMCLIPENQNYGMGVAGLNMNRIHTTESGCQIMEEKMKFYLNYFSRILAEEPKGEILILRVSLESEDTQKMLSESNLCLKGVTSKTEGRIEEEHSSLIADFANKYFGGGCMDDGCVQEEILFLIFPELLASRFFLEKMNNTEAILIKGCEMFSNYKNYGYGLKYSGNMLDPLAKNTDGKKIIDRDIVAIDALMCQYIGNNQFSHDHIVREVIKAYAGFSSGNYLDLNTPYLKKVSTGRWGCGAFMGDSQLKFLIQWIAASQAQLDMIFYQREDKHLNGIMKIVEKYKKETVGNFYKKVVECAGDVLKNGCNYDIFSVMLQSLLRT